MRLQHILFVFLAVSVLIASAAPSWGGCNSCSYGGGGRGRGGGGRKGGGRRGGRGRGGGGRRYSGKYSFGASGSFQLASSGSLGGGGRRYSGKYSFGASG